MIHFITCSNPLYNHRLICQRIRGVKESGVLGRGEDQSANPGDEIFVAPVANVGDFSGKITPYAQ